MCLNIKQYFANCKLFFTFALAFNKVTYTHMRKEEIIDKVGNTLIYFASNMPSLSKTKALKLIYLLDEFSIQSTGIPFFNLQYEAWKFGPVNQEIYSQLNDESSLASLKEFISITKKRGMSFVNAKVEFNDDEFSDNDINLLEKITKEFKNSNADKLIDYTHKKDGLWFKLVNEKGLKEDFDNDVRNTSNHIIDFHKLVEGDKLKSHLLKEYEQMENFANSYAF